MNKYRKAEIIWHITSFIKDIAITGAIAIILTAAAYGVLSS